METNEIMNNVELDDVIEVFQDNSPNYGFVGKMILGVGALCAAGYGAYKLIKKKKADKAAKTDGVLKFEDIEKKDKEDEEVTVE